MKKILIVAGEASADLYGAKLVGELKHRYPTLSFCGVGGEKMRGQSVDIRIDAGSFSAVGVSEWLDRCGSLFVNYRTLVRMVVEESWDGAVLIDLPDINLRLARKLKKKSIPVCYYVSPQLWAWRSRRIKIIRRFVDRMLVIYPFEEDYYRSRGVLASFVGHPLVDEVRRRTDVSFNGTPLTIALLPGSRASEIRYHSPILALAMQQLRTFYPGVQFVVPIASTLEESFVRRHFMKCNETQFDTIGDAREALRKAHLAVVASGTATLEATLIGVPFCLFYQVGRTSKFLFDTMVKAPFIGLPNILAKREIVREFFQRGATPEALVGECKRIIEERSYRDRMLLALDECRHSLEVNPAENVADQIGSFLTNGQRSISTTI